MRPGWVRTYTGKHVCLTNPDPETICAQDIAHQLSLEARWGGATSRHYSVAEHSIWVARFTRELVPEEHRELATVHALLHDAHEAYIKDIPTPLKVLLGEGYSRMADGLDQAIRVALKVVVGPGVEVAAAIKIADKYAAWCEAKALLVPCASIKVRDGPPEGLLAKVPMVTEVRRATTSTAAEHAYLSYLQFSLRQL